tara:strand:+ start:977 stop:2080 length:1104 start_codon:yes stop_codon:yes gene_type:complete
MKIAYIAETLITNKSAYTHHVLKMCDAFSNKHDVCLMIPSKNGSLSFKNLKNNYLFTSKKNFFIKGILKFKISNFVYRIFFGYKVAKDIKKKYYDIIITRSLLSSFFLSLFKINHFLEIHSEIKGLSNFLINNLNFINSNYIYKVIFISNALRKNFSNIDNKKTLVLHDAIDIKNFKKSATKKKIKTVTYVGSFYKGKGVELIIDIARNLTSLNFNLYGELNKELDNIPNNVKLHGHVDYREVPDILSKSDILLLPSASYQLGRSSSVNIANYNSPLKMFDYLASGKILVSSRLDGICEVLKHNYNSLLVKEHECRMWVKCLNDVLNNKYNLKKLRKNSIKTSYKFTWEKRINKIIEVHKKMKRTNY